MEDSKIIEKICELITTNIIDEKDSKMLNGDKTKKFKTIIEYFRINPS